MFTGGAVYRRVQEDKIKSARRSETSIHRGKHILVGGALLDGFLENRDA